jgi:hypothetical protein
MFVELSGLRWIKCWVKRTLKWRPAVFAVITSLFSAFDYVQFGHVELGTVVGSALFSVVDLYFVGVFWVSRIIAMACAEALERASRRMLAWCARNRTGLFAGFAFGLAFTVASGSLDLAACVCVAIYLFVAYFALGRYAGKHAKALKRSEVQPELEEVQLAPPSRKRLVFNIANPEGAERLMRLMLQDEQFTPKAAWSDGEMDGSLWLRK